VINVKQLWHKYKYDAKIFFYNDNSIYPSIIETVKYNNSYVLNKYEKWNKSNATFHAFWKTTKSNLIVNEKNRFDRAKPVYAEFNGKLIEIFIDISSLTVVFRSSVNYYFLMQIRNKYKIGLLIENMKFWTAKKIHSQHKPTASLDIFTKISEITD